MEDESISQQIDAIIKKSGDWRGGTLSQLRAVIKEAVPAVVEEVKWKSPLSQKESPFGLMMAYYAYVIRSRTPCG